VAGKEKKRIEIAGGLWAWSMEQRVYARGSGLKEGEKIKRKAQITK
jgi:hypothetical protein